MSNDSNVLDAVVKSLESRLEESEKRINSLAGELTEWRKKAHAHCPSCGTRSIKPKKYHAKSFNELPLAEAALMCLIDFDHPVSVRTLRMKLEELGYPRLKLGRYGNYLHTVVCRLIEAGKVQRLEGDEIVAI